MPLTLADLFPDDPFLQRQLQLQQQQQPALDAGARLKLSPLDPADEESMLSRVGGKLLGGAALAGDFLDKYTGGRALRGVLGGQPRELLSLVPGSDLFHLTDESQRVSGRDLTDQLGFTDKGAEGLGSTLAGVGAELLVNPANFLNPFAGYAAAGKVAGKLAAQGVGVARQYLPAVGRLADAAAAGGHAAARIGRGLFRAPYRGAFTDVGQTAALESSELERIALEHLRGDQAAAVRKAQEAGILNWSDRIRTLGEAPVGSYSNVTPQDRVANEIASQLQKTSQDLDKTASGLGFIPGQLDDREIQYLGRHQLQLAKDTKGFDSRLGNTMDPKALKQREDILRDIPGGTGTINAMSVDKDLSGINGRFAPKDRYPGGQGAAPTSPLQREGLIRSRYLGVTPQEEAAIPSLLAKRAGHTGPVDPVLLNNDLGAGVPANLAPLTPEEVALLARYEKSQGLARWAADLDPRYADEARPFFGNHVLHDAQLSAAAKVRRNAAAQAVHHALSEVVVGAGEAQPGYKPLYKVLEDAGFENPGAAMQEISRRAGNRLANAGELFVDPKVAGDAVRFTQGFGVNPTIQPFVDFFDKITNLTKAFQTAPFPGFHARNFLSGQFANYMLGAHDPRFGALDWRRWFQPVADAHQVLAGGVVEGASQIPLFRSLGYNDGRATQAIRDLAYQYGAVGNGVRHGAEAITAADQAGEMLRAFPGEVPFEGFGHHAQQWAKGLLDNPLDVSGVGANVDLHRSIKAGRDIGENVEATNRLGGFIAQLRQGLEPAEAGARVRLAHVDYSALSPFEKTVMRRVIPFYSYTRGIVPFVLENILEHPAGLASKTAQLTNSLRQEEGKFVPDYLTSGLAVPLGDEQAGTQRFLTKVDTPVESAFQVLSGQGLARTGENLLGEVNPLLKAPLEYATGKQFFTGRDLPDLYPITGNTLADQVIANSPASRLFSTYRTLTDPRKWENPAAIPVNLLTGLKVSDVDMEKARDLASREVISQALRGDKGIGRFETIYPRAGATLTPEQIALLRLNKTLEERSKKEAEKKRQQAGMAK